MTALRGGDARREFLVLLARRAGSAPVVRAAVGDRVAGDIVLGTNLATHAAADERSASEARRGRRVSTGSE